MLCFKLKEKLPDICMKVVTLSILLTSTCLLFIPTRIPLLTPPRLNRAFDVGCDPETRDKMSLTESTALGCPFSGNRYGWAITMATSFDFLLEREMLYTFERDIFEQLRDWDRQTHFTVLNTSSTAMLTGAQHFIWSNLYCHVR